MTTVRFVKSFSKGQITIPKEFRDFLDIPEEFWFKLYLQDGKIIAEPVDKGKNRMEYKNRLLGIKGNWINSYEIAKNRKQVEKQFVKRIL